MTAVHTDYRDVPYRAEYYDRDPMFAERDAKEMVGEVLIKWGDKK